MKRYFCTLNDPHIWEYTPKKDPIFFLVPPNDPYFSTKSYTECPLLLFSSKHLYVTFIFECPREGVDVDALPHVALFTKT